MVEIANVVDASSWSRKEKLSIRDHGSDLVSSLRCA